MSPLAETVAQSEPQTSHRAVMARAKNQTLSDWQGPRGFALLRLNGQIVAKEAIINWQILGYKVEVSLRITLDKTHQLAFDNFINDARKIQEIIEIQTFLGKVDVRLLLIAKNMDDYQKVYREKILHLPHIMEIEPLMHIARVQNNEVLPV